LKLRTVSGTFTYTPSRPVNCFATFNGWARKRWILRARATQDLVVVGELVDAEDGDDVLEVLVPLQHALDLVGDVVVLLPDDQRIERPARRGEGIDGRVQR